MSEYFKTESRVQNLEYSKAWKSLTDQEINNAYYLSKATWAGLPITMHQLCYEAPAIITIFQAYFQKRDFEK